MKFLAPFVLLVLASLAMAGCGQSSTTPVTATAASTSQPTNRVIVYYMHRTFRCFSCLWIENTTRQTLKDTFSFELASGRLDFQVEDYWKREDLAKRYDVQTVSVVVVKASGKPSLVDFGSKGCRPCDMLAPILETLTKKYDGQANVMFVSVVQEQILAARYGIEAIPVQVFFDKDGKEVSRHVGFLPQEEIEKQMAKMGVK